MIRLLWPLVLSGFALGLDAYVLAGLLPQMAHDLHTTQAMAGLGVALFTIAYAISAPVLASFPTCATTRTALLAGLGLFTLGNITTALASSLVIFLISRLIAGIGAGLYSPLATASAAAMVDPSQRGRALSLVLAGLSMGTALGVPFGLIVETIFGWRWTIALIVLLGLMAALGITKQTGDFPSPATVRWKERLKALREPFILSTLSVTLWAGIASLGLYTYIAEVLSARNMNDSITLFIWLWGLGGMVGAMLIGRILDHYITAPQATLILLSCLATGFAMIGYTPEFLAGFGCFLWGICGWACMASQQHALISHAPQHATAAVAWNSSANYLGSGIGAAAGSIALTMQLPASWLPAGAIIAVNIALLIHVLKTRQTTTDATCNS